MNARRGRNIDDSETIFEDETKTVVKAPEKKRERSINQSDLYFYSCEVFDCLTRIRNNPTSYLEDLLSLPSRYKQGKDKKGIDIEMPQDSQLYAIKEFITKSGRQTPDCIMWHEKIFKVVNSHVSKLNQNNDAEVMNEVKATLSDLDMVDIGLYNYVDTMDTLLLLISKSEDNCRRLLYENYNYGAVIAGFNNEETPLVKIVLANEALK